MIRPLTAAALAAALVSGCGQAPDQHTDKESRQPQISRPVEPSASLAPID